MARDPRHAEAKSLVFKRVRQGENRGRGQLPPVEPVALEGLFPRRRTIFAKQKGHPAPGVRVALEPLHPEDPASVPGPLGQPLVDGVDVHKEIAGWGQFRPRGCLRRVDGVPLVIEAKGIFLVHKDHIPRPGGGPQPRRQSRCVFPKEAGVRQVRLGGGEQPGQQNGRGEKGQGLPPSAQGRRAHAQQGVQRRGHKAAVADVERAPVHHGDVVEGQAAEEPEDGEWQMANGGIGDWGLGIGV